MNDKIINFLLIGILVSLVMISSCNKESESPESNNKIELGQTIITDISYCGAIITTEVVNPEMNTISEHGHCWSLSPNPKIDQAHTSLGSLSDSLYFSSLINNLESNKKYYFKPYVVANKSFFYGSEISIEIPELVYPSVHTSDIAFYDPNTVWGGGDVTSNGYGTVIVRGVCWNTTGNPTLENYIGFTSDSIGMGSFSTIISGLQEGETYFFAAYAKNEKGLAYGTVINHNHLFTCGDLFVYEGISYATVEIGNQCWFKKNLNVGTMVNGSNDQNNNQQIEKYCYNNSEMNCDTYGGLYQWDETMKYTNIEGTQGICPQGWHIPSYDEWNELVSFLGGGNVAGEKMKTNYGWDEDGNGSNSSGFSAIPAGGRYTNGEFYDLGGDISLWTSTESADTCLSWFYRLYNDDEGVGRGYYNNQRGYSVRCLRDY